MIKTYVELFFPENIYYNYYNIFIIKTFITTLVSSLCMCSRLKDKQ